MSTPKTQAHTEDKVGIAIAVFIPTIMVVLWIAALWYGQDIFPSR